MFHLTHGLKLVMFVLLLSMNSSAFHNDATESIGTHPVSDTEDKQGKDDANQARNGGRWQSDATRNDADQSQMGCRELRSTKYISDGQCTSVNPIKELVCAGDCLPTHLLPNWIGSGGHTARYWSRQDAQEWRCVIDRTRTQRIRLQCQDGSTRTYKITVVISCKCKRYSREQNDSGHKDTSGQSLLSGKQRKNMEMAGPPEESGGRQADN
ncbi:sclerostin domain-containing protein 1-like [Echeneis naucrates]|uniref:Sclerostin domain-containing protein 1-like n=1 Tax=Echeneis naucrates TaxID=173247 RepID=A0A665VWN6_ECHNA|nr:sclerostin domain-containing protein 1-like [Echeneis naucrates]